MYQPVTKRGNVLKIGAVPFEPETKHGVPSITPDVIDMNRYVHDAICHKALQRAAFQPKGRESVMIRALRAAYSSYCVKMHYEGVTDCYEFFIEVMSLYLQSSQRSMMHENVTIRIETWLNRFGA